MMKSVVLFLLCEVANVLAGGITQCLRCRDYAGQYHQCGQWVRKATSSCNTCYCNQGTFTNCRDDPCQQPKTCRSLDGQIYQSGEWVRKATTACNTCFCNNGIFTNCKDDLCSTTCKSYTGQIYQDGQYVVKATGPCTACHCSRGQFINCRQGQCEPERCKQGQCPPESCKHGPCQPEMCKNYLGQIYQDGQYVEKATGPCTACYCSRGQFINCRQGQCEPERCKQGQCPPESCKHGPCLPSVTCKNYLGQIYQDGQYAEKATGPCTACYCSRGQFINCRQGQCEPERCKHGQCHTSGTCKDYLGQVVQNGKSVQQSSATCHTCVCRDGQLINCQPSSCDQRLSCTDKYGKVYKSGDWVPNAQGDCISCTCNNGRFVNCSNYNCQVTQKV